MDVKVPSYIWPDLLASSTLITLTVYHLMIFWERRRERKETYNLYFAGFVFSAAIFIIAPYFQSHYFLNALKPDWLNVINIEMAAIWLLVVSAISFLNHLLEVSSKYKKRFRFIYLCISLCVLLTLTSNLISKEFYFKHVLIYLLAIVATNILLMNFLYGYWIFEKGLFKERFIKILYFGYLLLSLNTLFYRTVELMNIHRMLIPNHYLTVVILYLCTYALAVKFNKEHGELSNLKLTLDARLKEGMNQIVATYHTQTEYQNRPVVIIPSHNDSTSMEEQFLHKALMIIEKNINESGFNTEKLCWEIGISRAHLYRKLKSMTGQSATEFIRSIRLKRAAELLDQKAATVSEIAYITGFNNLSYFSRCFKEEYGVVPSEYPSIGHC